MAVGYIRYKVFVATFTRSGSSFLTHTLKALGMKAAHERVRKDTGGDCDGLNIDVGYRNVSALCDARKLGIKLFRLVRHPIRVMESWSAGFHGEPEMRHNLGRKLPPERMDPNGAAEYFLGHHDLIDKWGPMPLLRTEDGEEPARAIMEAIGHEPIRTIEEAQQRASGSRGASSGKPKFTIDSFLPEYQDRIAARMAEWGYDGA